MNVLVVIILEMAVLVSITLLSEKAMKRMGLKIINELRKKDPKRNVIFVAIEQLKEPEEIRKFYGEYIEYLKREGVAWYANKVANLDIRYALGYYSSETAKRWLEVLPSLNIHL